VTDCDWIGPVGVLAGACNELHPAVFAYPSDCATGVSATGSTAGEQLEQHTNRTINIKRAGITTPYVLWK